MMTTAENSTQNEASGTNITAPQSIWRFHLGDDAAMRSLGSYAIRKKLKDKLNHDLRDVTLRFSAKAMTMTSRTPDSSLWMQSNMSRLFAAVADEAGQMLAVDLNDMAPSFEPYPGAARGLYVVPRLVVANSKRNSDWDVWRKDELTPAQMEQLKQVIEGDLAKALAVWGINATQLGVVVIDGGRPMPIVQGDGPRAMARLGVKFISPWQLDGEFFVGKLTPMGFGVIKRGGIVA